MRTTHFHGHLKRNKERVPFRGTQTVLFISTESVAKNTQLKAIKATEKNDDDEDGDDDEDEDGDEDETGRQTVDSSEDDDQSSKEDATTT